MARQIALSHLTLLDCDLFERVRIAGTAGYDLVGIRVAPVLADEVVPPLLSDAALRRRIVIAMADAGVRAGDIELVRLTAETDVASLEPLLACAEELGARHLLTVGADIELSRLTEKFAELCEAAARYRIFPEFEFSLWSRVPDLATARAVVEGAGRPEGGVLIDALHAHRAGVTASQIRATPQERIRFVQICDAMKVYDHNIDVMKQIARRHRLPPGDGELDLVELINAAPPEAVIAAEVPNEALQAQLGAEQYALTVRNAIQRVLRLAAEQAMMEPRN